MWACAQMFGCRKKMSAIAILDYSGAEAIYHHMEALAQQGRTAWLAHNAGGGGAAESAAPGPSALSHSGSSSHLLSSDASTQLQVTPGRPLFRRQLPSKSTCDLVFLLSLFRVTDPAMAQPRCKWVEQPSQSFNIPCML